MNAEELRNILAAHTAWIRGGTGGKRADLSWADLSEADLSGANLSEAHLSGAHLSWAHLSGANLSGANLSGAHLSEAIDLPPLVAAKIMRCPPEGAFIAWKQCAGGVLVKLLIPADARRSSAAGHKCRAEFADVLEVIGADAGISLHNPTTIYAVGERVTCDAWDENRWNECGGGIHFYMSREEAEAHS